MVLYLINCFPVGPEKHARPYIYIDIYTCRFSMMCDSNQIAPVAQRQEEGCQMCRYSMQSSIVFR